MLEAEIARRNARLRAWRAYGVPVEGWWEVKRLWAENIGGRVLCADLAIKCLECGWSNGRRAFEDDDLASEERATLNRRPKDRCCPHLAPLLGEEPEGFEGIVALELLAGEGPR